MDGWIKLHRSVLDSPQFTDETVLKVWIWLLCEASIKERNLLLKIGKGKQVVKLKRSQLIFGRNQSALRVGIDPNVLYRIVNKLHDSGSIIVEANNQYSIITVCNYNDYQSSIDEDEFEIEEISQATTTNAQATNKQPTTNAQPATHNKKVNKVKKVKNVVEVPEASSGVEKKETVLHYAKMVDTWFIFYEAKFKSKPTFKSVEGKHLKFLIKLLEQFAAEKKAVWSESTAVFYFNRFLEKAYQDDWLRNNFLLPVLVQKYDSIKNQKNGEHKANNSTVGREMEFDKP